MIRKGKGKELLNREFVENLAERLNNDLRIKGEVKVVKYYGSSFYPAIVEKTKGGFLSWGKKRLLVGFFGGPAYYNASSYDPAVTEALEELVPEYLRKFSAEYKGVDARKNYNFEIEEKF